MFLTDEEAFLADSEITSFTLDYQQDLRSTRMDVEPEFDPSIATYETLTEEQKALLSPATKKRFEDEWQARLIAQLPIYYASYMGCRSVIQFDCVNRVEEGAFGVVYRAKNNRTGLSFDHCFGGFDVFVRGSIGGHT
ncbi:hypothetical protein KIN20_031319 [Parelaphostrongylus tenuis]|uniref:Protein kinase domain-containing protein n=1 Tax=Parelaphostrongylus tenuis TaxID=148309 RepID=A0AAD5R6K3_PARTN|nr:hypothetical protein KIN20_031319 [Parelaphostrongylus tenuis]